MVSRLVMPPSRISGSVSSARNCFGVAQQVGLAVGVFAQELLAGHPHAPAQRRFEGGGELLERGVAAEQVHRVEQRAARGQFEGVQAAVVLQPLRGLQRLLDADAAAHAVGHVELGGHRDRGAPACSTSRRTASTMPRATLARFSSDPPNSSSRRLISGLRNELARVVVAEMDLDGVEAGVDGEPGGGGVRGDHVVDVVAGRPSWRTASTSGLKNRTGASALALLDRASADRSGVPDLRADRRALGVDGLGEALQPGHRLRPHPDLLAVGASARADTAQ